MATMKDYGNNIGGLRRALRSLPKETADELKGAAQEVAQDVANVAKPKAASIGRGFELLGPTIKAERSGIPSVKIGGKRRIPGRTGDRQTIGDLLFGTEFGGRTSPRTMQFLPHLGQTGYALWPAVRERSDESMERYSAALLAALEKV